MCTTLGCEGPGRVMSVSVYTVCMCMRVYVTVHVHACVSACVRVCMYSRMWNSEADFRFLPESLSTF